MKNSTYSKMYLVVPSVYDKVLKCIDEKDKKTLEQLNIDKDEIIIRPSEKYFEDIVSKELQENDPKIDQPKSTKFINQIPEQTFGSDNPEFEQEEINIETNNPLKTDCPDVQDQFIPQVFTDLKKTHISKPKITPVNKKQEQMQNIQKKEIIPQVKLTRAFKNVPRNFVCNFCSKPFKSTYHLNRHIKSVHKDLLDKPAQSQLIDVIDEPIIINHNNPIEKQKVINKEEFPNWQEQPLGQAKGKKRTSTEAKINYLPKPPKTLSPDYDEWN